MRYVREFALLVLVLGIAGCGGGTTDSPDAARLRESAARAEAQQAELAAREESERNDEFNGVTQTPVPTSAPTTTPPADEPPSGEILSAADLASFEQLASDLPGSAGIAVSGLGRGIRVQTAGAVDAGVAWSTAKVPVAMAAVAAGVGTDADLRSAITVSDNAAAERLFAELGGGATAAQKATAQVRVAGDDTTAIEGDRIRPPYTPFGQTNWSLADQTRFAAGMGCTSAGKRVLNLMRQTTAAQRWGLGQIGRQPAIKGGWGPGISPGSADGWLERQMGIVRIANRPVAITIASTAASHEAATSALDRIAAWAQSHANSAAAGPPRC